MQLLASELFKTIDLRRFGRVVLEVDLLFVFSKFLNRALISEQSPDGAARIFPNSYATTCFQTGTFEGRSTD